MEKIVMNLCASADSFGAYSENCEGIYAAGDTIEACKKDAELANKLQSQAKGLDPDIPDLPAEAESQGSNKWLIASVAVGAASVLGLAFFRQIRKFR